MVIVLTLAIGLLLVTATVLLHYELLQFAAGRAHAAETPSDFAGA
jgi:hypothetical protein